MRLVAAGPFKKICLQRNAQTIETLPRQSGRTGSLQANNLQGVRNGQSSPATF
jgi:hypothetical protein